MSVVVCFFLLLPTKVLAVDTVTYYTYFYDAWKSLDYSWDGYSNTMPRPLLNYTFSYSDIFGGRQVDTDLILMSFFNHARLSVSGTVFGDMTRYYSVPRGSFKVLNTNKTFSFPYVETVSPYQILFPQASFAPVLFCSTSIQSVLVSSVASVPQTLSFKLNFLGTFSLARRIDTQDTSLKLVAINDTLEGVRDSIVALQGIIQQGFSNVDSRLLAILNAINQSSSSGGGTAAIVGAVNGATAAIGQVLSQQQASSADIVGAVNSQTSSLNSAIQGQTNSLNSTLSLVDASINKITSTLEQDKQDSLNAATEKGNELTGMATQIRNTAETSWDALSFPIDFTNQVFQVFSGGTSSAAYTRAYGDVLGYRYNSDTGGLEPIYRRYRDGTPRVAGGTTITFPAFSFFVPGVGTLQLWDSYEFDLSVISRYLPALFDALHLIIGILLIYWMIGYLVDLGHDIIG